MQATKKIVTLQEFCLWTWQRDLHDPARIWIACAFQTAPDWFLTDLKTSHAKKARRRMISIQQDA